MLIAAGQSRLRPERPEPRAAARSEDARRGLRAPDPRAGTGFDELLREICARGDRLPQAGRARARRLALLPRRQAVPGRAGQPLENFTRLETSGNNAQSGNNDVQWVKVTVSEDDSEVFTFEQEIVRPNLVAYAP